MSQAAKRIYEFDKFRLNATAGELFCGRERVQVAPKVLETLVVLVEHQGDVVAKNDLMAKLWPDTFVEESNLTQNVFTLRKILGEEKEGPKFIETVPRRGYRFTAAVRPIFDDRGEVLLQQRTRTHIVVDPVSRPGTRAWLVVAVGTIAVGAGAAIFMAPQVSPFFRLNRSVGERAGAPAAAAPVIKRLTYDSQVYHPAISPDGAYLAYNLMVYTETGPKQSIRLQNIATGSSVEVMPPAMPGYGGLTFSPDGNYLYFTTPRKDAKNGNIARAPVFGGAPRDVATNVWSNFTLSPDGQQVAFVRWNPASPKGQSLIVANVNDGQERDLTPNKGERESWFNLYGATPSWSSDGETIAVTGGKKDEKGESGVLFEVRVDDGRISEIPIPRWAETSQVSWLSDGKGMIVVAREKDASPSQVWQVAYPSGDARKLTNDLADYGRIGMTADDRLLIAQQTIRASQIWLLTKDGAIAGHLTSGLKSDGHSGLAFAPDGRVIFISNRGGGFDIWTMDAGGGNLRQLTNNTGGWNWNPSCSPDGRYIVFTSNRSGRASLWRMDSDGNNPRQLAETTTFSPPFVSPDSQSVYYVNQGVSPPVIERIPIDGGQSVPVTSGKYAAGTPSVSPDGKLLAHTHYDDVRGWGIAVIPVEGGDPIEVFKHAAYGLVRWTPDSDALIYIKPENGNLPGSNLWLQPLNGGPPRKLTDFGRKEDSITNFAVSADGKQLLIARGRLYSDVVLLNNFR